MFKKDCVKCGERINKKHSFCPLCGAPQRKAGNVEDWGMLGKEDMEKEEVFSDTLFRGFSGGILNKMLGSAMKMLENEMKKEMSRPQNQPKMNTNIRLMINGKEVDLNNLKNVEKGSSEKKETKFVDNFPQKSLEMFSKLPKKEPTTTIKRLADKIIYEIALPGVNSLKEMSIVKLESSIEIKAVSKKYAYFKLIPINLPIKNYDFAKGKLVLELDTKN